MTSAEFVDSTGIFHRKNGLYFSWNEHFLIDCYYRHSLRYKVILHLIIFDFIFRLHKNKMVWKPNNELNEFDA